MRSKVSAELPAGPWNATLTLTSGLISHDVSADVTFPDAGETVTAPVETNGVPWLALVAAIAGILILAALLELLRRRRATGKRRAANHDV